MEKKSNKRTFILEWRPAISSYKMNQFEDELKNFDDVWFNWSIWEWEDLQIGDELYMIKCGEGNTGIVMHGFFTSDAYEGEDWSGKGRTTYYADFEPDTMIHPDKCRLLTTDALAAAMPDFKWNGGHSGRILNEEYAEKLGKMWAEYLEMNNDFFDQGIDVKRRK